MVHNQEMVKLVVKRTVNGLRAFYIEMATEPASIISTPNSDYKVTPVIRGPFDVQIKAGGLCVNFILDFSTERI